MAARTIACRYCGQSFAPQRGKPGYIDECPDCLYERTAPHVQDKYSAIVAKAKDKLERELVKDRLSRDRIRQYLAVFDLFAEENRKVK